MSDWEAEEFTGCAQARWGADRAPLVTAGPSSLPLIQCLVTPHRYPPSPTPRTALLPAQAKVRPDGQGGDRGAHDPKEHGVTTPCGVRRTGPASLSAGMNSWAVSPEVFALLKFCRVLSEPRKSWVGRGRVERVHLSTRLSRWRNPAYQRERVPGAPGRASKGPGARRAGSGQRGRVAGGTLWNTL